MLYISNKRVNKKMISTLIIIYLVILLWVIVFKCNQNQYLHIEEHKQMALSARIEPYPFKKMIDMYKRGYFSPIEITAFIFNMICLTPFGALLKFYTDKKWLIISLGTVFSIGVEIFQLFSGWGGLEYTDIAMMILGVIAGVYIHDPLKAKMGNKLINKVALFFVVIGLPLVTLVVIKTINNFPI